MPLEKPAALCVGKSHQISQVLACAVGNNPELLRRGIQPVDPERLRPLADAVMAILRVAGMIIAEVNHAFRPAPLSRWSRSSPPSRRCLRRGISEPFQNIGGASIWREHRIEDVLYDTIIDNQGKPLQKRHPVRLECRQIHRASELQVFIRENRERQMQAFRCFALIRRVLRRKAEKVLDAEHLQFGEVVAKGASLRRAPSRAWY